MKKNKWLLVVFILLAAVAVWLIVNNKKTTINQQNSDFAIEDTAAITKIFLADKNQNEITLTRTKSGQWTVNNKATARPDAITLLLSTIKTVEVRSPVGKASYDRIIKYLSSYGVKVEIYVNDELAKTYYVGGATQDHLGTEMYLEGTDEPFITHIPGFNGFLTPRYFTNYYDWVSRSLFNIAATDIKQVKVTDHKDPNGSFIITCDNKNNKYQLTDGTGQEVVNANPVKLKGYTTFFEGLNFESVVYEIPAKLNDSILTVGSFCDINITTADNKTQTAKFFRKPVSKRATGGFSSEGVKSPYDLDRMYTLLNGDTLFLITQYNQYNRLFRKVPEFIGEITEPKQTTP
ncbi:MAG: DUF4340 domain-containing protein [Bacteroidia bacterium]|nr:DUF4340 domain-containing protein [Bacteroidia bacterium]